MFFMNEIGKLVCGVSVYFGENVFVIYLFFFLIIVEAKIEFICLEFGYNQHLLSQSGFININILATKFFCI